MSSIGKIQVSQTAIKALAKGSKFGLATNIAKGPGTLRQIWIDAAAFFQISMTTPKKWRIHGVKCNRVNAEEVPALAPLRLLFLRFLSLDYRDNRLSTDRSEGNV